MSDLDYLHPVHRVRAMVGGFLQDWAFMEAELHSTLRKALGLDEMQGAILTANIQLRDKISILRTIAHVTVVGPEEEKRAVDKKLLEIADYATTNRNMMAHNMFALNTTGEVEFFVIKAKGKLHFPKTTWDEAKFEEAHSKIEGFRSFLKSLARIVTYSQLAAALAESPKGGVFLTSPPGSPFPPLQGALGTGPANPEQGSEIPPKPKGLF